MLALINLHILQYCFTALAHEMGDMVIFETRTCAAIKSLCTASPHLCDCVQITGIKHCVRGHNMSSVFMSLLMQASLWAVQTWIAELSTKHGIDALL